MLSTMQDFPLEIGMIYRHGRTVNGNSQIVTYHPEGSRRASFAEVADRADLLAAALARLGIGAGRPRRHVHVERRRSTSRRTSRCRASAPCCTR